MPTKYAISDDSITDHVEVIGAPDIRVAILLRELRRERTGMHGLVAVAEGGKVLAHDTFNIGRQEDRRRLSKSAHAMLNGVTKELLQPDELAHRIDLVCLYATTEWELERVAILEVDPNQEPPHRVLILPPHVEVGTGNIFFAPPGAGKSFLMTLMAISLTAGIDTVWRGVRQTPCLYVDLERGAVPFQRRLSQMRRALRQSLPSVAYLRGRGMGLSNLRRKLKGWAADHPNGVILYDSISRMGGGSLIDDDTSNAIIDMANTCSDTWVALAHSPRADASHAYGSVMWDAGADMVVKLTSQQRANKLGCVLNVTKANHAGSVPAVTYELEFDEYGLSKFGLADAKEWPDLAGDLLTQIVVLLEQSNGMSATEIAKTLDHKRQLIDYYLKNDRFERLPEKSGREVLYRVKPA